MKTLISLVFIVWIAGCATPLHCERQAIGEVNDISVAERPEHSWQHYQRLTGEEIKRTFSDVLDQANVVDGAGGTAINYWYENGRFTSNWKVAQTSGRVSGQWFVKNNLRCVILDTAVAEIKPKQERCGPVYSKDRRYYSVNRRGGVHGVHVVSNLREADAY